MEKTPAELEAEKQAAEDEAQNNSGDATDGGDGSDDAGSGVHKKDYLKMSEEEIMADLKERHKGATPEQLLSELAKQVKIIGHKNRAIDSLKDKNKPEPNKQVDDNKAAVDDLDKPLTKREMLEWNNKKTIEQLADSVTKDAKEKQAIIDAYEKSIVKTGDVEKDFNNSLAIANQGVIKDYKKNQSVSKDNENYIANFSGGSSYRGPEANSATADSIKRATAENLKKAGYKQEEIDAALAKL